MYSGAHGPANDLDTVLQAAEILRDHKGIRFVFVGSGKEKARLEALAEENPDNGARQRRRRIPGAAILLRGFRNKC